MDRFIIDDYIINPFQYIRCIYCGTVYHIRSFDKHYVSLEHIYRINIDWYKVYYINKCR